MHEKDQGVVDGGKGEEECLILIPHLSLMLISPPSPPTTRKGRSDENDAMRMRRNGEGHARGTVARVNRLRVPELRALLDGEYRRVTERELSDVAGRFGEERSLRDRLRARREGGGISVKKSHLRLVTAETFDPTPEEVAAAERAKPTKKPICIRCKSAPCSELNQEEINKLLSACLSYMVSESFPTSPRVHIEQLQLAHDTLCRVRKGRYCRGCMESSLSFAEEILEKLRR